MLSARRVLQNAAVLAVSGALLLGLGRFLGSVSWGGGAAFLLPIAALFWLVAALVFVKRVLRRDATLLEGARRDPIRRAARPTAKTVEAGPYRATAERAPDRALASPGARARRAAGKGRERLAARGRAPLTFRLWGR
jgi:hypothetical protein